jgi:betaine lipid synthase
MEGVLAMGQQTPSFILQHAQILLPAAVLFAFLIYVFDVVERVSRSKWYLNAYSYLKFFYASFLKPHDRGDEPNQQFALESFYRSQAQVYDVTRARLLRGREDLLGLLAAQLKYKMDKNISNGRPVWVDVSSRVKPNLHRLT